MKMKDDWETPKWLMEHFKTHNDPCPLFRAKYLDGLKNNWKNPAYVNPPYSNPLAWVQKAIEETKKGVNVVMLLRVDPSTKWYRLLVENNAHFCYFNERLKFSESKNSPSFSSMLVFLEAKT
jgi:hypothetical protein